MQVLANASRWEGMPNVVLQAMLSGVPVIATDVEGVVELIQDGQTGLIVKPAGSNELRQAMEELLADTDLRLRFSELSQQLVIKRFTMDSMTQRYAHMVDDSLQKATDNMAGVIDRAVGG